MAQSCFCSPSMPSNLPHLPSNVASLDLLYNKIPSTRTPT